MKAVVVGAGVLGSALARTLAREGHEVTLVDQYGPGHPRAASAACTRILRLAHGEDLHETQSAWLSRTLWKELERDTGRSLFAEVGMAWLTGGDSSWEAAGRAVLESEGIEAVRLSPSEAERMLPGMRLDDLDDVLFEPQSGLLHATESVQALVEGALEAGASILHGPARQDGASVTVAGERLEGDHVVWACGAWTPKLFPELVRGTVIQQDVCYLRAGKEWRSPPAPAWGESSRSATGSGNFRDFGFKVGLDTPGPTVDPDSPARPPVPRHEADARVYLGRRFPALAASPLLRTETCQTVVLEPDLPAATMLGGEVRLVRHPEHERTWLLGDGSGHAFKHAPAIAVQTASTLDAANERRG
jgi:glycine/D-amino acid oxidase-like deaminating enzyme